MNAYSDIFVSFHKIYTQIVEHGTQTVIKRVYWLSVFKIDQNKYTEGHFLLHEWGLLSQHFYILWSWKKNKFSMKFWLHTSGPWKGYFNHCTVLFQNRAMMFGLTQVNNSNIWAITNLTYMSYYQQLGIHSLILMKKLNHLIDDTIAVVR